MLKKVKELIDHIKAKIGDTVSFPLQRWVRALACRWLGHRYGRWDYAQREWRSRGGVKGRHIHFDFQYECDRCGAATKWIKWRYKEAFDEQHGLN